MTSAQFETVPQVPSSVELERFFSRAEFVLSAVSTDGLPLDAGREVAFAGRSNAGKSSAINAILGRRRLAYVSKQPGRTREVNFFSVVGEGEPRALVDLPGYGFAGADRETKYRWSEVISDYLVRRQALTGLVLLVDSRHGLKTLDQQFLAWFAPTQRPVLILLTKADKLSRAAAKTSLGNVESALQPYGDTVRAMLFSTLSGDGVDSAKAWVAQRLSA